jgi:hypothetical protein
MVWMRRVKSKMGIVVRVPGVWMACTWEIMSTRAMRVGSSVGNNGVSRFDWMV